MTIIILSIIAIALTAIYYAITRPKKSSSSTSSTSSTTAAATTTPVVTHPPHAHGHGTSGWTKFFGGVMWTALALGALFLIVGMCSSESRDAFMGLFSGKFSRELQTNEWSKQIKIPVGEKITEMQCDNHRFWMKTCFGDSVLMGPGCPYYSNLKTVGMNSVTFRADSEPFTLSGKLVDM